MKRGQFISLVVIFFLLLVVFYFVSRESGKEISQVGTGAPLFHDLDIEKISVISIRDKKDDVTFTLKDDLWLINKRWGYPANFGKIHELALTISQIRPDQLITRKKEHYGRFGVEVPSKKEGGKLVVFLDNDKKILSEVILGKDRKGSKGNAAGGGQYIRRKDREEVYLISNRVDPSIDPKGWLRSDLVDVKDKDIRSIFIEHEKGTEKVVLKRKSEKDEIKLVSMPKGKKTKKMVVNSVAGALSNLSFDDVYPEKEDTAKDIPFKTKFTASLFNGVIYKVKIGEKENKSYIKIAVDYKNPIIGEKSKKDETGKPSEQSSIEIASKAKEENEMFSGWVYEIPSYRKDRLIKKRSDLFE